MSSEALVVEEKESQGKSPGLISNRQREPTNFKGVTRTCGANTGLQKYDVQ
jgi:hypothetical protein